MKPNPASKRFAPPQLPDGIVCITDYDNPLLTAVVSSYFTEKGVYIPFFLFPNVNAPYTESHTEQDDDFVSQVIGNDASVLMNNAVARIGSYRHIVLIGLSEDQKSFLYWAQPNSIIEIQDEKEAADKLKFLLLNEPDELACKPGQVLEGLFLAKHEKKILTFQDDADDITDLPIGDGMVLVEQDKKASSVLAVNYAHSIGAGITVVPEVTNEEAQEVQDLLLKGSELKNDRYRREAKKKVLARLETVDFENLPFLTCFTQGFPYSLALENKIPISYVHLRLRSDFFVFNAILSEYLRPFNSAVVFSPGYWAGEEETEGLIDFFEKARFYVKALLGKNATVRNFAFYTEHFPYDVLHICSHGGETDGYGVTQDFVDREGGEHVLEYDQVVGFAPIPGTENVELHSKAIFRKLDGKKWMSPELRALNLPHYVFEDMRKAISMDSEDEKDLVRRHKKQIPTSCAIRCYDSIHQAMFRSIAAHNYPLIFNNTCWSWYEVSHFFMSGGARGYIGTLWAINNAVAVKGAETFYKDFFNQTFLESFVAMCKAIKDTDDENVYMFWGFHFSTLAPGKSIRQSRLRVCRELTSSFLKYLKKIRTTKVATVKKNSMEIAKRLQREIFGNFSILERGLLMFRMQAHIKKNRKARMKKDTDKASTDS